MKKIICYALIAIICSFFSVGCSKKNQGNAEPVKIIFDSDMGPDYDDVGAIAILHALAAKGECEILATVASDGYPYIAPTLEVFNRYFGKPDIPIGVPGSEAQIGRAHV